MTSTNLTAITRLKKSYWLIPLATICLAILFAFNAQQPSSSAYHSEDVTNFSQKNALNHLKQITKAPHYLGSKEHKSVQDYLITQLELMGLDVEIFEHLGTNAKRHYLAANTKNIIAKISTGSTHASQNKAIALVSHYDSGLHSSKGASDAGSGVVTILEGVRAFLAQGETPLNDIIIILTDGEERGLLGAQAFVNYHPWAQDVEIILNFEARGSGGPSYMILETNQGNKQLVNAFADANVASPAANSLMYSIYKMLPNDTDLTIFREDGDIQGFNFAFIDDHFDYHTVQDSFERLDRESLNHQAEYLMALLGYFAKADLSKLRSEIDLVYFNFPIIGMVTYPFSFVSWMTLIASLLLLNVTYFGLKRQQVTITKLCMGFAPLLTSLVTAGIIGYFGWHGMLKLYPQYADIPHGFTYNGHWILAAFIALTVASTLLITQRFERYCSANNRYFAGVVCWLLINVFIANALPGAGFLILPVYFALAGLYICTFKDTAKLLSWPYSWLLILLAIPPAMLISPLIPAFVIGLGLKALVVGTLLTSLLVSLLTPLFFCNVRINSVNAIKNLSFAVAVLCFVVSAMQSTYSADRKKPNSINYIIDNDNQRAYWVSSNKTLDEFTQQFFTNPQTAGDWQQSLYPNARSSKVRFFEQASFKALKAANVNVTNDQIIGEQRTITMQIIPQRATNLLQLSTDDVLDIKRLDINGQAFLKHSKPAESTVSSGFFFSYTMAEPFEQLTIELTVAKENTLSIKVFETAFDLLESFDSIKPRSDLFMPEPFIINDATIIGQRIDLLKATF